MIIFYVNQHYFVIKVMGGVKKHLFFCKSYHFFFERILGIPTVLFSAAYPDGIFLCSVYIQYFLLQRIPTVLFSAAHTDSTFFCSVY